MILRYYKNQKQYLCQALNQWYGFTLVELVVALAILMLIVFAFTPLLVGSIERIYYAGDKSEALYESQAEMEVNIVKKDTIDGHEIKFEFDDTTVIVPGGFIEVEQSKNTAMAWLSTFLPYVPSIKLSDSLLTEGYQGDPHDLPVNIMGRDTKLEDANDLHIFTRSSFEEGNTADYILPFQLIAPLTDYPGYDEYALFYLPAGPNGLTNANSPYMVEINWMVDDIQVSVRSRLHIMLPNAVAVGGNGAIVVSPDADNTWNPRNNDVNVSNAINDVLWASFRFVAITSNGKAMIWGNQEEPKIIDIPGLNNVSLNSITSGNGKLVAVGNEGAIVLSNNGGESWTLIEDSGTNVNLNAIIFNGNEFLAVGEHGTIVRSENGTQWEWLWDQYITEDFIEFNGIAYGNGTWVAVGAVRPADPAAALRNVIYSGNPTGIWEKRYIGGNLHTRLNDITYSTKGADDKFVAVGTNGKIMISSDGVAWDPGSKTSFELNSVFYDGFWNQQYIIAADDGNVITGKWDDWTVHSTGSSENLKGVTIRWEN